MAVLGWTEQSHPWLHWSSKSSVSENQLVDRYRVLDAHKYLSGHFGQRARGLYCNCSTYLYGNCYLYGLYGNCSTYHGT